MENNNNDRTYLNSAANCYDNQYFQEQIKAKNKDKSKEFRKRFDAFEGINSIEDAKALLDSTIPVANIKTTFMVGDAKVFILNTEEMVRISFSTPEEFIAYSFVL